MKSAREPASSRPKIWASLKKPHEPCPFAAPCGPRRKKKGRSQTSCFPSKTFRFAPLMHRGSALPWLIHDRAALRLRRIGCMYVCVCMATHHDVTRFPRTFPCMTTSEIGIIDKSKDATAEHGRDSVYKHHTQPEYG